MCATVAVQRSARERRLDPPARRALSTKKHLQGNGDFSLRAPESKRPRGGTFCDPTRRCCPGDLRRLLTATQRRSVSRRRLPNATAELSPVGAEETPYRTGETARRRGCPELPRAHRPRHTGDRTALGARPLAGPNGPGFPASQGDSGCTTAPESRKPGPHIGAGRSVKAASLKAATGSFSDLPRGPGR
jgi:hypothetical protein